jgi:hypothetical protein
MPGCSAIVAIMTWRQDGWRGAWRSLRASPVWAAFAALHYVWSIRYATGSKYLHGYWDSGFPPLSATVAGTLHWLAGRFEPLALNPGGATVWTLFWIVAVGGLAIASVTRPAIGLVLATVPVSAFVLVAFQLVPLSGRLSLWIVPALYFGIASSADAADRLWRGSSGRLATAGRVAAAVGASLVLWLCIDVLHNGEHEMANRTQMPHGFDDRTAVRFLMAQRQPGDAVLAMHLTLPAVWWYGHVPLSNSGSSMPDGGRLFEVTPSSRGSDCSPDDLRAALGEVGGAAFYLGFDVVEGFDALLLNRLSELGALTVYKRFGTGHTAVIDFRLPPSGRVLLPGRQPTAANARARDCVAIHAAERW